MKEQVSQTKKGSVLRTSMYVAVLIGLAAEHYKASRACISKYIKEAQEARANGK